MIRPLRDRIVVKPEAVTTLHNSAGIQIMAREGMHSSREQLGLVGEVVAVGPGKRNKKNRLTPLVVKEGDRITFGEFKYPEYFEDGQRYLLMQEADVEMILDGDD